MSSMYSDYSVSFNPPPVLDEFMCSDQRIRAVRGPVGSGKSSAMVMELFRRGCEQQPGKDGIRRTRAAIIRNTLEQLRTTCLPTIITMLGPLARWKVSDKTVWIEFDDVVMEWLFLPLDTPDNVRRLLSLELTFVWVSEFREISPQLVNDAYSRCGRYPSQMVGGPTWYGLMMETNSFSEDSQWYGVLEEDLAPSWGYFVQPPGLPAGENLENLPATYYQDQIENNGGEDAYWVQQYVFNKIAPSLAGEAVFRSTFIHDFHTTRNLIPIPQTPLCIGIDTGRNPAAILTQVDPRGRFLVLGETWGAGMSVEKFVSTQLVPLLHSTRFHGIPVYGICDPSSNHPTETGEESVIQMLNRLGVPTVPAMTNKLEPRLRSVEGWMLRQFEGKAAFVIDAEHCPDLTLALQSRYRFKKRKVDGILDTSPEKTNPWADLADALQYACLGGAQNIRAAIVRRLQPRREDFEYREVAPGAWT